MNPGTPTTRRDFLRQSAAVAGALSLPPLVHAAGSDVLKVGLVGCGGRGVGAAINALSVQAPVKLWAIGDAFADQIDSAMKNLITKSAKATFDHKANTGLADKIDVPLERRFTGLDAFRKVIDSGVDVLVLAAPPGFRPLHYEAAVKAGKHVFMEKPVCVDAPGYKQVMAANKMADEKNLRVVVGLQRRSSPNYVATIRRIHEGAIGDVRFIRVYWNGNPIWIKKKKPEWSNLEAQIRNWNVFRWLSGDHIVEQHVHNLDIGCWIMKDAHPVEARGMGGREMRRGKDSGHIFDHHAVEFTFADGTKMFSQCRQMLKTDTQIEEWAHGSKGVANVSGHSIDGETKESPKGAPPNAYQIEHDRLFAAIVDGRKLNEGWHAANSTMVGILGRMATYSGLAVKWDEAVEKGRSEAPYADLTLASEPPVLPDESGNYDHLAPVPGRYRDW